MTSAGRMVVALVAIALAISGAAAERSLQAVTASAQVSIPWNPKYLDPTAPMPIDSPQFVRQVSGLEPDQIHLTYVSASSIVVSWATGEGIQSAAPVEGLGGADQNGSDSGIASTVYYGTAPGEYSLNTSGTSLTYQQIYTQLNGSWPAVNYTSPLLHHVTLVDLTPATQYFYIVGDDALGLSEEYNFTTAPAPGTGYPLVIGVFADLGETLNSSATIDHLRAHNPQFILTAGDLTYADDITASGVETTSNGTVPSYPDPEPSGTYQPRWDAWYRWLQPLLATTPWVPQHGNHELEPQGNATYHPGLWPTPEFPRGSQFQSYVSRNPVPYMQAGSPSPLFYSVDLGPAHIVHLSNYDDFSVGSPQYEWLVSDLASFDRATTPWLIANWHAPWYSSYTTHYAENQCMREAMEPVLYEAGVDLVINGHLHTYERSYSVYNYTVDPCGPVHVVIGDGGNIEGLYKKFAEQGTSSCPAPGRIPKYQPGGYCPEASFPYDGDYCPTGQPAWSAFRQPAYGHAILTFENATHLHYQFHRNLDSESVTADDVFIVRDLTCANKATYPEPTPAATSAGR